MPGIQPGDRQANSHPLHGFHRRLIALLLLLLPLLLLLVIGGGSEEVFGGFSHGAEGHAVAVVAHADADLLLPRENLRRRMMFFVFS